MRTFAVIRREYLERVRSKSFLVGTILGPLLMSLFIVIPALVARSDIGEQRTIGVIDPSGRLLGPLRVAVGELQRDALGGPEGESGSQRGGRPADAGAGGAGAATGTTGATGATGAATGEQPKLLGGARGESNPAGAAARRTALKDRFTLLPISVEGRSVDDGVAELKRMVRDESIHSGIVFDPDFVRTRRVTFYSKSVSGLVVRDALGPAINRVLRETRFAAAGVPDSLQSYLSSRADWNNIAVTVEGESAQKSGESAFMVGFSLIMILYFMVVFYGAHTLTAVIEEKSSRVYEVLLSSMPSGQLMFGKVIGIGLAGLTQTGIWTAAFVMLAQRGISVGSFTLDTALLTPVIWVSFVGFFLLGFFLYALLYAGVGAMCQSMQDAQQFNTPIVMGLVLPMMLLTMVLRAPNSTLSVVLSLIPMFSPVLMFIRVVVQTPPLWQIGLSWVLMIASIWLAARMAGKLFRLGILMHGASPTWGTLVKALRA